ncbi:MAG: hypothetical protein U5R48_18875 [Gammaproteobacteria bacterium]|nr:hypothetical protein [Gammaproteobacteria bacterium]
MNLYGYAMPVCPVHLVDRLGNRFGRPPGQVLRDFLSDQLARALVQLRAEQPQKRGFGDDGK